MTEQTDTIAGYLAAAAQIIRERGYDRRNESLHNLPDDAPLSVYGALHAASHTINLRGREWELVVQRVNGYWRDTLGDQPWHWEFTNRHRDVTADEVAAHLDAAANYHR